MMIQKKLLAAFCAMAIAPIANAFDITTTAPVTQLYMTGSSALQNDILNAFADASICSDAPDLYRDNTGGGNFLYVACTSALPTTLGQPIALAYRAQGGSYFGTYPVGSVPVGHYTPSIISGVAGDGCPAASAATKFTPGANAKGGGANCTGWTLNSNTTVADIPDVGVSDEEPSLFSIGLNQPQGSNCLAQGDTTCVTANPNLATTVNSTPVLVQAMGLVATQQLIDAMVANGYSATNANGKTTANFPRQWITESFASGGLVVKGKNWSRLSNIVTAASSTPVAFTGPVVLCRRAAGSGTQAALGAHFFNNGCQTPSNNQQSVVTTTTTGVTGTAVPAAGITANSLYVIDNTSSGAVKTCMATASANGYKALGVLSFDQTSVPGTSGLNGGTFAAGYDFIAIDGAAITDANVQQGVYWNSVESTMQTAATLTADKSEIATALQTVLKTKQTQANGVYSVKGTTPGAASKVMSFTTNGNTCAPAVN